MNNGNGRAGALNLEVEPNRHPVSRSVGAGGIR
jgi:hypothetical protein